MVVEPLVVALLLAAALMHATWNALLKADRSDRLQQPWLAERPR